MAEPDPLFDQAMELLDLGNLDEALVYLQTIMTGQNPTFYVAMEVGQIYQLQGKGSYAAEAFRRACDFRPQSHRAWTALAEALRTCHCYHSAIAPYTKSLELRVNQLYALAGLAECYRMIGDIGSACQRFNEALEVAPQHSFALRGKAACLNNIGAHQEALTMWEQAISYDPANQFAANGLAQAKRSLAKGDEFALTNLTYEPLKGESLHFETQREWAQALATDKRYRQATTIYIAVLRLAPERLDVHAELGAVYEAQERWGDAQEVWERILQVEPRRLDIGTARARALSKANSPLKAIEAFSEVLSWDKNYTPALLGKGWAYLNNKQFAKAMACFDGALVLRPHSTKAIRGKASCLLAESRYTEARPLWKRVLAAYPCSQQAFDSLAVCDQVQQNLRPDSSRRTLARPHFDLATSLSLQSRHREAVVAVCSAIDADPNWVEAWLLLGRCHLADRQNSLAFRAFDAVLFREPEHHIAQRLLADANRQAENFTVALRMYNKLLQNEPEDIASLFGRAESLRLMGKAKPALARFRHLLQIDSSLISAKCGEAACLNSLSRFDEALKYWKELAEKLPKSEFIRRGLQFCEHPESDPPPTDRFPIPQPRLEPRSSRPTEKSVAPQAVERAKVLLEEGRSAFKQKVYNTAISKFEQALIIHPRYAEAALRLGMALEDDRRYQEAIASYERCLSIDPTHHQAATNVGEAYRKDTQYDKAISAYDKALSMRPDYLYALAGRAECMRMLGDYEGALQWFDRALEIGPRHAFAVQGKAAALNALARFEDALPMWEKALVIEPRSPFAVEGKSVCERGITVEDGETATPELDEQAKDLTALALLGELGPIVGRDIEIRQVMKTLMRRVKGNPILLGEPGVGKTAIVEGLACLLASDKAPKRLKNKRVLELSMGSVLAGTKYRGTFEERLKNIIEEAKSHPEIILFIDEIHTIVGAGRTEGGSVDAANLLKPALARGEITVIGATTRAEFKKHIEGDSALERRFQPIRVEEPTEEQTLRLLQAVVGKYEVHHEVKVDKQALEAAIRLSTRYLHQRFLPDKALDLLDEACADASIDGVEWVNADRVARVISEKTGVAVHEVGSEERASLLSLGERLNAKVFGQQDAVEELTTSVQLARAGLRSPKRPRGVFLFVGASGVGKTELAKALADAVFPEGNALVKIDLSEYSERFSASRLMGAPPGYAGHGEEGLLTGALRSKPYSVVLLDEFDKAHPDVQATFLALFDDGMVTDAEGRQVCGQHAFFILTANIKEKSRSMGYGSTNQSQKQAILKEVKASLSPELFNRIDSTVIFDSLPKATLQQIALRELHLIAERAAVRGCTITWHPDVTKFCVDFNKELGARPTLRAVQQFVANPLSRQLVTSAPSAIHLAVHQDQVLLSTVDTPEERPQTREVSENTSN